MWLGELGGGWVKLLHIIIAVFFNWERVAVQMLLWAFCRPSLKQLFPCILCGRTNAERSSGTSGVAKAGALAKLWVCAKGRERARAWPGLHGHPDDNRADSPANVCFHGVPHTNASKPQMNPGLPVPPAQFPLPPSLRHQEPDPTQLSGCSASWAGLRTSAETLRLDRCWSIELDWILNDARLGG